MQTDGSHSIPSFHQRFDIEVDLEAARERFINRVLNDIEGELPQLRNSIFLCEKAERNIANHLGTRYAPNWELSRYIDDDFFKCLHTIEALYETFSESNNYIPLAYKLEEVIEHATKLTEIDLGVKWSQGRFWPSGAKLLDDALVNDNLKWLSDKGYQGIVIPFEKGLRHFLEAQERPERLSDTITDVYEALEALARIITEKPHKDLSQIREVFISQLKLGSYYKKMFKDYIEYACQYRHAVKPGEKRATPSPNEVEAFIYMTGLFIRLAIQQLKV